MSQEQAQAAQEASHATEPLSESGEEPEKKVNKRSNKKRARPEGEAEGEAPAKKPKKKADPPRAVLIKNLNDANEKIIVYQKRYCEVVGTNAALQQQVDNWHALFNAKEAIKAHAEQLAV